MSAFTQIAKMNFAYGNPPFANLSAIEGFGSLSLNDATFSIADWEKLKSQAKNIQDEYVELMDAIEVGDVKGVRDAVCDIMVFTAGVGSFIGQDIDADLDMVYNSNMSKFCKDGAEVIATVRKYDLLGVETYVEGEVPAIRVKCAKDFTDAAGNEYRTGKLLKGINYQPPVLL